MVDLPASQPSVIGGAKITLYLDISNYLYKYYINILKNNFKIMSLLFKHHQLAYLLPQFDVLLLVRLKLVVEAFVVLCDVRQLL